MTWMGFKKLDSSEAQRGRVSTNPSSTQSDMSDSLGIDEWRTVEVRSDCDCGTST